MGRNDRKRHEHRSQPAPQTQEPKPVTLHLEPVAAAEPVQSFSVVIENRMAQSLEVSVLNEDGSALGLRLAPRGKSHPIQRDRVGRRTFDLVALGRARIVPVS